VSQHGRQPSNGLCGGPLTANPGVPEFPMYAGAQTPGELGAFCREPTVTWGEPCCPGTYFLFCRMPRKPRPFDARSSTHATDPSKSNG